MESRNPNQELWFGAKTGNMFDVVNAIDAGADVNVDKLLVGKIKQTVATPIMLALKYDHTEIVIKFWHLKPCLTCKICGTQSLTDHLANCIVTPILIRLFSALKQHGLKDETLINLLPKDFSQFKNQS